MIARISFVFWFFGLLFRHDDAICSLSLVPIIGFCNDVAIGFLLSLIYFCDSDNRLRSFVSRLENSRVKRLSWYEGPKKLDSYM